MTAKRLSFMCFGKPKEIIAKDVNRLSYVVELRAEGGCS